MSDDEYRYCASLECSEYTVSTSRCEAECKEGFPTNYFKNQIETYHIFFISRIINYKNMKHFSQTWFLNDISTHNLHLDLMSFVEHLLE